MSWSMLVAQGNAVVSENGTQQVCQLISANPPEFRPFAFVPNVINDKGFKNRHPKLSLVVGEDGNVREVKIVRGTGAAAVDAAVIKSVKAWKYRPQVGCVIETALVVTLEIGPAE